MNDTNPIIIRHIDFLFFPFFFLYISLDSNQKIKCQEQGYVHVRRLCN